MAKNPIHYFFILFLMISINGFGQNYSISGSVMDQQNVPVSYATILVMTAQDSTIVKGTSTNEEGFFKVDDLEADDYLVQLSFIGFDEVLMPVSLSQNENLGTIILKEATQNLDEVTIIARRPTLIREPDRLVFNVENTALIEGDMFQLIKSTPGVLVIDDQILVKNSTPTVYINDRKVHLSNEELIQLLESSSANSIKSVEVITNPSARYDAESGTVINIVMGKNLIAGYRGNVFTNYTQGIYPRYDGGMSHFFKNENINFFANYTYSHDKLDRYQRDEINYLNPDNSIDQTFASEIGRTTRSRTHNLNFNFDYSIDQSNTLSLSSSMLYVPYFDYRIKNRTDVFDNSEQLDFYFNANNMSDDDKYNLGFDLDFVHRFKNEGERLSFNAHFTTYDYRRDQNVSSDYFDSDNTFLQTTAFRTDNNQDTEIYTGQLDYVLPTKSSGILESGLKASNITTTSDITQFDIVNGEEFLDVDNTNAFDYDENILAAYANWSRDWEKLSLVAGLRVENTKVEGLSVEDDVLNKQDYTEWFPSASINYSLSEDVSIYANYKRSIQRPNYQNLNPFQFFLNDFTIVTGNPNLQPVLIDHAVIGTNFYKQIFTVEAYYKVSNDNIFELPRQDNVNNILTYTPVNIDRTTEYGFDFIAYFNVLDNWTMYAVTSFYNTKDEGAFNDLPVSRELWSNYSILSNNLSLLKDRSLNVNLTLIYSSRNIQGFTESASMLNSDLAISKKLFNKKATVSLIASDLFNRQDYNLRIRYLNQNNRSHINLDTRTIKVGFRYNFGNTKLETNEREKSRQETERLESGDF